MSEQIMFASRDEFKDWLHQNHNVSKGVWLVFSKTTTLKTVKPGEALEEALCYGWIDGLIKRLDDEKYLKKFSPRTKDSKWSAVNKGLATRLIEGGRMTDHGLAAIEYARKRDGWKSSGRVPVADGDVSMLTELLRGEDLALANFLKMPPSVRSTYTAFYLDAKREETRKARLAKLVERLKANKKPME